MKIRNKVSIIIFIAWFIILVSVYLGSQIIFKKSFLHLEQEAAISNLQRVDESLQQMATSVNSVLGSWSIWDDTYKFMADKNQQYIKSNLQINSFSSSDVDMVLYFDKSGKPFYSVASDTTRTKIIPVPKGLSDYLDPHGKLVYQPTPDSGTTGIISLPDGLLFVAAHSIVTSKQTGPVRGTLMMGKHFTESSLKKLKDITKVNVSIYPLNEIKNNTPLLRTYDQLKAHDYLIHPINDSILIAYTLLKDINGKPIAIIKANITRKIYLAGLQTIHYYNILTIAFSIMLVTLLWTSLNTLIIKRIEKMTKKMASGETSSEAINNTNFGTLDEVSFVSLLYQHATHDQLTGLGNRHLLYQGFQNRIETIPNGNNVICVFIDIDHFKYVNDTLGHEIGDELLVFVAKQLKSFLRGGDIASRLGGDEFVVMLFDVKPDMIAQVVDRLFSALKKVVIISGHELTITCSMGISIYPTNGNDVPTLLKNADFALYRAKEFGRNQYQYYSDELKRTIQEANKKELELQRAIDNKELCLYYQPIYDTFSKNITNAEALIRWNHPERGILPAAEIIPIAEKCGLIIPIGQWVLKTACAQAKAWQDQGLPRIPIAVNLSLLQIKSLSINKLVTETLEATGLDPHYLELELTETSYVELTPTVLNELQMLKERGIKLAVDDFGVGYSGLGYLKRLPIHKLKIDQSFIRDIHTDTDDRAIVLAIIAIAHQLSLQVVAEGVETNEQLEFLRKHYVDSVQGNYLSKPVDSASFEKIIKTIHAITS